MTYTWPDGYWNIKNHPKMKGVPIEYMQPKEGRLAWVCGLVLGAETKVPGRATSAVAAANAPKVARLAHRRLPVRVRAAGRRCGSRQEQGDRHRLRARPTPPRSRRPRPGSRHRCRTAPSTSRRARTSRRPSAPPDRYAQPSGGGRRRPPPETVPAHFSLRRRHWWHRTSRRGHPLDVSVRVRREGRPRVGQGVTTFGLLGPTVIALAIFFLAPLWYIFEFSTGLKYFAPRSRWP